MPDTVPFCPACGPSSDPSVTKCPRCGESTYPVLRRRKYQPTTTPATPWLAASPAEDRAITGKSDPQRAQKILLLIFFLAITFSMIGFGLFAPDSQFTDDAPRGEAIFLGVCLTITSTLWFFFGTIDWSMANKINRAINRIAGNDIADEQEEPSSDSEK